MVLRHPEVAHAPRRSLLFWNQRCPSINKMRWFQNWFPLLLMFAACVLVSLFAPSTETTRAWSVFEHEMARDAPGEDLTPAVKAPAKRRAEWGTHGAAAEMAGDAPEDDLPQRRPAVKAPAERRAEWGSHGAAARSTPTKRKRVTPFVAKKVAARQQWRCAMCGELLLEDFEVDHHIPLHAGGQNDLSNYKALHKKCHLFKNSLEQRKR